MSRSIVTSVVAVALLLFAGSAPAAIVFDNFNVDEGHFNLAPTFSGSSTGLNTNSTADRIASPGVEGAGFQQLVLNDNSVAGGASRLRHLSGGGNAGSNIAFSTSGGVDGWIGFYLRTTSPGWTAQIWIEGASNNGGVPKTVVADGDWHLYEWDLDDTSGGADGWGSVSGIIAGSAIVADGSHTIDSVLLRHTNMPSSATIDFDFVAKSDSGSIAPLVPEPASLALLAMALPLLRRRR